MEGKETIVCGRCSEDISESGATKCTTCEQQFCPACVNLSVLKNPCSNGLPHKFSKIKPSSVSYEELNKEGGGKERGKIRESPRSDIFQLVTSSSAPTSSLVENSKEEDHEGLREEEPTHDDLKALHRLLLRFFSILGMLFDIESIPLTL